MTVDLQALMKKYLAMSRCRAAPRGDVTNQESEQPCAWHG
jgi:hypothetical protein